jgi:hypothetical protein
VLTLCAAARASAIDVISAGDYRHSEQPQSQRPVPDLAVMVQRDVVAPPSHMSELPEPEVFAMMLLGLCLIGYRVGRDSSDKFK